MVLQGPELRLFQRAQLHHHKLYKRVVYIKQCIFGFLQISEGAAGEFKGALGSWLQLISRPVLFKFTSNTCIKTARNYLAAFQLGVSFYRLSDKTPGIFSGETPDRRLPVLSLSRSSARTPSTGSGEAWWTVCCRSSWVQRPSLVGNRRRGSRWCPGEAACSLRAPTRSRRSRYREGAAAAPPGGAVWSKWPHTDALDRSSASETCPVSPLCCRRSYNPKLCEEENNIKIKRCIISVVFFVITESNVWNKAI